MNDNHEPEPEYSDMNPWLLLVFSVSYLAFLWSLSLEDEMKYYLTDGEYVEFIRQMSPEQAARKNEQLEITTGGNWWWSTEPPSCLVNPKEEINEN